MVGSQEIIKQLKSLEQSRLLDREIAMSLETGITKPFTAELAWHKEQGMYWLYSLKEIEPHIFKDRLSKTALKYTTSLDAAMTLIPTGWVWPALVIYDKGIYGAHCKLHGPSGPDMSDMIVWGEAHLKPKNTAGYINAIKLLPIAICIASLEAREKIKIWKKNEIIENLKYKEQINLMPETRVGGPNRKVSN